MSVQVFNIPSDSSYSALTGAESNEYSTSSSFLSVHDVRITPGCMHFENAFEGKSYKQKLTIQNCGRRLVYVRLLPCSSTMFEYKPFQKGICLSPGMKIVRTVKYTYLSLIGTLRGMASIWINNEEVVYKFYVSLSTAVLEVIPQVIDFGQMDAVNHTATRIFRIKNDGYRAINFAIDLGRNALELNVQPTKGTVHAKSSVTVTTEIVGTEGGDFCEEFWIKTNPPQRLIVKGSFVAPKLLVRKFTSSLDFKLVNFPPTYYGSGNVQMVLVENDSASSSMFCVMAEIQSATMTVEEAKEKNICYQCFEVTPMDGRIEANKGSLLQITFKPIRTCPRNRTYAVCFFKVIRMDCQDVSDASIYDTSKIPSSTPFEETTSLLTYQYSGDDVTLASANESVQDSPRDDRFGFEHSVKFCVYGEKEVAGVDLTPSAIHLAELTLEREYERTVLVKNKSQLLPIKVKYNKIGCVTVRPDEFDLQPSKSLEVLVIIHTIRFGEVRKKITFDLLSSFRSMGETIVRKVGTAKVDVHLEVLNVVKRTRMRQCTILCKELPEKLVPEFPYRFNDEELAKKVKNDDYYLNYVRSLQKTSPREGKWEEYADKLTKCWNIVPKRIPRMYSTDFIPLIPRLLYNIKIRPKSIRLRNLTQNSTVTRFFEIQNMNTFPIRVFAKPSKSNILFQNNGRCIIQAGQKKKITFSFITTGIGRYYGNISVLINDSTFYEVTTVANVFSKNLTLDADRIVFQESGPDYKYMKLTNPFTCVAYFAWELTSGSFEIYPRKGKIRPESSIFCLVSFNSISADSQMSECLLKYENGQTKKVMLSYIKDEPSVVLDSPQIDMSPIPLNISKKRKVVMRNLRNFKVCFRVVNPSPIPGVSIEPINGTLMGLDTQVFVITVHIPAVIEFRTKITFMVDEVLEVDFYILGVVECPKIELRPSFLQFRKIAPYSYDTQVFRIQNMSESECFITFPSQEMPEFTITSSEKLYSSHEERLLLQAKESRLMYMHFQPEYTCTYSLFLCYITNDILGPAPSYSPDGDTTMYYLEVNTKTYAKYPDAKLRPMPESLKTISINCTTSERRIKIPKLVYDFVFFGDGHSDNVTESDFVISNVCEETVSICIRIDNLGRSCFSLVPKTDNCEVYNVSYKVDLEPGTTVVFEVGFYPTENGDYTFELPIFLRHYNNNRIFNYLTLNGVFKTPTMHVSLDRIDFEPVFVKLHNKVFVTVEMRNHFDDCQFSLDAGVNFISLVVGGHHKDEDGTVYLEVGVICLCDETDCFDTNVTLRCSCGSSCSVPITGVVENCLLTTHVYANFLHGGFLSVNTSIDDVSADKGYSPHDKPWWFVYCRSRLIPCLSMNTNETTYPLFPSDGDRTDYAKYMRSIQQTLENWIFSQGFYKRRFYRIPEGFTDLYKPDEETYHTLIGTFKKPPPAILPLLELVINFTGRTITEELNESPPDNSDHLGWFSYTCRSYSQILQFLRNFPFFAPHVESKFLLNYDQYVLYEKIKRPQNKPLDETIFYRRSKQCWIDLILQIIKTFVVFHTIPKQTFAVQRSACRHDNLSFTSGGDLGIDIFETGVYGCREMFLLAWLQKLYNFEKGHLWGSAPQEIDVVYFDENLRNGLVLAAATAHYCPYIVWKIQEMYSDPQTPEEYHTNACILVQTWDMLGLSYVVKPSHILHGGMLKMLLLVVYLYNVLPNLTPKEKITIEAKLTKRRSKSIDIQNRGEYPIYYKVIFFHNEDNQFSVGKDDIIKVEASEVKTVEISYYAKRVKPETATLLFSGETPGHKYGRSIVVTLEGSPDIYHVNMEVNFTADLYKMCKITFPVATPFKKRTSYKLFLAFEPITKESVLHPFESLKIFRKVCEVYFENVKTCEFNAEGRWINTATVCLRRTTPRNVWMYFTHPEEGDFGLKMIIAGKPTDDSYEDIDVWITPNYKNFACKCKPDGPFDKHCPRTIEVALPKRNDLLWNARKAMVLQRITEEEKKFWATRLYTQVGTRVLRLIMSTEHHPWFESVEDVVEYDIDLQPACCMVTVPKVTVDDIISDDTFTIPIHVLKKNPLFIKDCVLHLNSKNEVRFYKLNFKLRQGEGNVVK